MNIKFFDLKKAEVIIEFGLFICYFAPLIVFSSYVVNQLKSPCLDQT